MRFNNLILISPFHFNHIKRTTRNKRYYYKILKIYYLFVKEYKIKKDEGVKVEEGFYIIIYLLIGISFILIIDSIFGR